MMATQDKYERRPLDGFAARGFSAAYDEDRARAEKELANTMAGPSDACSQDAGDKNGAGRSADPTSS